MNSTDGQKKKQTENNQGKKESSKLDNPHAGTTLRRFALEASVLATLLWMIGFIVTLVSMFSGIGPECGGKAFGALLTGFFAWKSIQLLWEYYRSKDEEKRTQTVETLNIWGFLWIGVGLAGLVLGGVFGLLVPVFNKLKMVTLFSKVGSIIGLIVVGGWIYWAVKSIRNKKD